MSFSKRNIQQSERKKMWKKKIASFLKTSISFGAFFKNLIEKGAQQTISFAGNRLKFFRERQKRKRRVRWIIGLIGILFGSFIVFETSIRVAHFFQNFTLKDLLWFAGTELPTDEYGMTNILLLGVGGENHSGGTLTDSVIVASIDYKTKSVSLLSIPRDFYIDTELTSGRINAIIRDVMGDYSVSERDVGYNKGVAVLKDELEDIFQIKIHRYLQIDFSALKEGIDAIGGIDVFVEKTIDDSLYPTKDWKYEHFYLPKGRQTLDGETALKYVRSRHGSSDFERSERQQRLLQGVQEKAISTEILTSPKKLKELYTIVQRNIKTDIEWREIISLGKVGYSFPRENIFSFGLNNDETKPGGFLVTPDRELYGGAFVLVPFLNLSGDKYAQIRIFAENIFRHRELRLSPVEIEIQNGSNVTGLAGKTAENLERFGIPVKSVENSKLDLEKTTLQFVDIEQNRSVAELLQNYFDAELLPTPVPPNTEENSLSGKIVITVGQNHKNFRIPTSSQLNPQPNPQSNSL